MIWIAIWTTFVVVSITDVVMDRVHEKKDWAALFNVVVLGLASWCLLDAINTEFLTP